MVPILAIYERVSACPHALPHHFLLRKIAVRSDNRAVTEISVLTPTQIPVGIGLLLRRTGPRPLIRASGHGRRNQQDGRYPLQRAPACTCVRPEPRGQLSHAPQERVAAGAILPAIGRIEVLRRLDLSAVSPQPPGLQSAAVVER